MVITDPPSWKERFYSGLVSSPKFDKIKEMIAAINANTSDSHPDPHPHVPQAHSLDSASHSDIIAITEAKGKILWWDGTQWNGLPDPSVVDHVLKCSNIDGTIIWGAVPAPSGTSYYSISRFEIVSCLCRSDEIGAVHSYDWDEYIGQAHAYCGIAGTYHMGVHLPHGAVVTALRVIGQEASKPITTYLYQETQSSGAESEMATVGSTSIYEEVADTTINNATIDNDTYAYFLKVVVGSAGGNAKLRHIQIDYT